MKIYLVGGSIRDELLKIPSKEKDWVVIGSSKLQMLELGFSQIGNDFPVFLHPNTKEEFALARTEKKSGLGYRGFLISDSQNITLKEDLERRDLTINSLAKDPYSGEIIDYFDGKQDIYRKILRHISSSFGEDPLRVLRVARFAARFADFRISYKTFKLMRYLVKTGELSTLSNDRIGTEFLKALREKDSYRFFTVLRECNCLKLLFPELENLYGKREKILGDCGIFTLFALYQTSKASFELTVRFSVFVFYLTKFTVSAKQSASNCAALIKNLVDRFRLAKKYKKFAQLTLSNYKFYKDIFTIDEETILIFILKIDGLKKPRDFNNFLLSFRIIANLNNQRDISYLPNEEIFIRRLVVALQNLKIKKICTKLKGPEIKKAIFAKQVSTIRNLLNSFKTENNLD